MTKKLNEDLIQNELKSGSVFFNPKEQRTPQSAPPVRVPPPPRKPSPARDVYPEEPQEPSQMVTNDTMTPWYHDTTIETVRKAVKRIGKEGATYRFTAEEKRALSEIVYTFRGQDIRTSENEITRIALNVLIVDYRERGQESFLARVLEKLNE